jgi:hypothetical protein
LFLNGALELLQQFVRIPDLAGLSASLYGVRRQATR